MRIVSPHPGFNRNVIVRVSASGCCLLFALGATANQSLSSASASSDTGIWAAPVDEAPAFVTNCSNVGTLESDVNFVAQGWRWSPGSTAWIAVLVRVDAVRAVGLARIGGRYGP